MRRVLILFLTFALAGVVAPATAASSTRVDFWLDRDPGPWTGGMVVIRRGGKYWAYAKFFEGRVCLSGRRNGSTVRMKGTFEQYEREPVNVRWRLRKGMPKVAYTLGTAGEWRRVNRADFVTGTTTGPRLVDTARITTPARWRSACAWTSALGARTAAGFGAPLLGTGTVAASAVTVLDDVNGGKFVTRPSHIGYTSDTVLGRLTWGKREGYLRWRKWNRRTAKGVGTLWAYCGVECWSSRRAGVTLSRVRDSHFTRMTIRARYDGVVQSARFRMSRGDVGWYWGSTT